jgi:hypothetical protein
MSNPKEGSGNVSRPVVELKAHDLNDPEHRGDKAYTEQLSMGSKAHLSFAPDPDTGKGFVSIPGAAATTLASKSNWDLFRQSLYNSGLPEGIFEGDMSVLDGMHVHIQRIPEPEERKTFRASTGEAAMSGNANQAPKTIPVVSEIHEDGKPWEGTGGVPEDEPKPAKGKATAKAAAKPAVGKKPAPAPEPEAEAEESEDAGVILTNALAAELEKKPNGLPKLALRTSVFSAVKKANGNDVAQAVSAIMDDAKAFAATLGELGYQIKGVNVSPTA